jgi:hypothetical protein
MTTPRIHLGLKPQAIGSNPLKRVHESIGVAVQPFNFGSGNLFQQVLTISLGFQP